jgi:hypothetical protein
VAEEPLHETFSGATKSLGSTLGFLLLMFGGEAMLDKPSRPAIGLPLCVCGTLSFYIVWLGRAVRKRLSNDTISKINQTAGNPAWWLGTVLSFVLAIAVWRFATAVLALADLPALPTAPVQQKFPSADEVANAVLNALKTKGITTPSLTLAPAPTQAEQQLAALQLKLANPRVAWQNEITVKVRKFSPDNRNQLSDVLFKLSSALDMSNVLHDELDKVNANSQERVDSVAAQLDKIVDDTHSFLSGIDTAAFRQRYFQEIVAMILTTSTSPNDSIDVAGASNALITGANEYLGYLQNIKSFEASIHNLNAVIKPASPLHSSGI